MNPALADLSAWLNGASPALLPVIVELSLKSLVLLGGAWAVALFLRRGPAAQRHALWSVAISIAVILPLLSLIVPAFHLPLPGISDLFATKTEFAFIDASSETSGIIFYPIESVTPSEKPVPPLNWQSISLLLWLVGTALVAFWLLAGRVRAWRLIRRAIPLQEGRIRDLSDEVTREFNLSLPRIKLSAETDVPMIVGVFRPTLLVPEKAELWSDSQLRTMLLHELAHVQRGDLLAHTPAFAALALHWLNPLVWLATRKQVFERELAADEAVLSCGVKASDYAKHLLTAAGHADSLRFAPGTTAGMARGTDFKRRVHHILNSAPLHKKTKRRNVTMTILTIVLLSLPIAAWQPWVTEEPQTAIQTPTESPLDEAPFSQPDVEDKEFSDSTESTISPQDKPFEVAEDIVPPEVRFSGKQPFPGKAKAQRQSGQVKVRLIIRANGDYEVVRIVKENPPGFGFGEATREYLKQGTWKPAMKDGKPIDVYFDLAMNFWLKNDADSGAPGPSPTTESEPADDVSDVAPSTLPSTLAESEPEDVPDTAPLPSPDQLQSKDGIYFAGPGGLPEPKLIKRVEPEYPETARALRASGHVQIEAVIDEKGLVESVKVLITPRERYNFAEAAIKAVKQWKFEPTTINGKPVKVRVRFSVEFNLVYD